MGRLLGDLLIESGACTLPQFYEGLRKAAEIVSRGEYRPIGEILVDLGYVSIEQLETALSIQDGETPTNKQPEQTCKPGSVPTTGWVMAIHLG